MNKRVLLIIVLIAFFSIVTGLLLQLFLPLPDENKIDIANSVTVSPWDKNAYIIRSGSNNNLSLLTLDDGKRTKLIEPEHPKNSSYAKVFSDQNTLYYALENTNSKVKVFRVNEPPVGEIKWEELGIQVELSVLGVDDGYVFFSTSKNDEVKYYNTKTGTTESLLKFKNETGQFIQNLIAINSGKDKVYLISTDSKIMRFDKSTNETKDVLKSSLGRITLIDNKIFVLDSDKGIYLSTDEGQNFKLIQKGLDYFYIGFVLKDSKNDRIIGESPTGKHVFVLSSDLSYWKPLKVKNPWSDFPL